MRGCGALFLGARAAPCDRGNAAVDEQTGLSRLAEGIDGFRL